ncbi:MAG: hypothetical protein L0Y71_02605 [Gemmataceae bacterium]|nr:hypothetical protein [Gemmataceae bacterium]
MPSNAFKQHLLVLLGDADELLGAHAGLRTGKPGRQWGLGALNRAVVVICVSAWQAYVQEVTVEAMTTLRPAVGAPLGAWYSLNASTRSSAGRLNTTNVDNVRMLLSHTIGLQDVTASWFWKNCTSDRARQLLAEALTFRHQIAHGVNPSPVIQNAYATWLPTFFRRLGVRTDAGIRDFLVNTLGIANPWPA